MILSVCQSVRQWVLVSLRPVGLSIIGSPVRRSVGQSVSRSVRPSGGSSVRPSARPPVRPSVRLSVRQSVRPPAGPPARPSARPSVRPSVDLPVHLSTHACLCPVRAYIRANVNVYVHLSHLSVCPSVLSSVLLSVRCDRASVHVCLHVCLRQGESMLQIHASTCVWHGIPLDAPCDNASVSGSEAANPWVLKVKFWHHNVPYRLHKAAPQLFIGHVVCRVLVRLQSSWASLPRRRWPQLRRRRSWTPTTRPPSVLPQVPTLP